MQRLPLLFFIFTLICGNITHAQSINERPFFQSSDTLNNKRLLAIGIVGATSYTASMITLNEFWYKGFEKEPFHTFNDWGEWENMDKYGHAFSAYIQSKLFFDAVRWTGLSRKKSALASFAFSTLAQTSIEFLDSRSARWGWSWYDVAFNTGGSLLFCGQEFLWGEQKLRMKFSYTPTAYSRSPIINNGITSSIEDRANESFGDGFLEQLVKDYNGQTIWLSLNLKSTFAQSVSNFPAWLNIAVGYGAQDMLGAFGNGWTRSNVTFRPGEDFVRHKQLFISFDIDLEKLPIKNKAIRGLCKFLNIIKIPSPTMEFNSRGEPMFHWLYF